MGNGFGLLCLAHGDSAVIERCSSCQRGLCERCETFNEGELAICRGCEARTRSQSTTRFAVSAIFSVIASATLIAVALYQKRTTGQLRWVVLAAVGGVALLVLPLLMRASRPSLEKREAAPDNAMPNAPYRAPGRNPARMVARAFAPPILTSAKRTVIVLGLCLLFTGVAVPFVLHQAPWVEMEAVLGASWLALTITLAMLLYRGHQLHDDHKMGETKGWNLPNVADGISSLPVGGDAEGCLGAIVGIIVAIMVAIVAFIVAWFLIELLLPALAYLAYVLLAGAINNVTSDRHGCQGKLGRSIGYGTLWSTVYLAPIATTVWAVHAYLRARHGV